MHWNYTYQCPWSSEIAEALNQEHCRTVNLRSSIRQTTDAIFVCVGTLNERVIWDYLATQSPLFRFSSATSCRQTFLEGTDGK